MLPRVRTCSTTRRQSGERGGHLNEQQALFFSISDDPGWRLRHEELRADAARIEFRDDELHLPGHLTRTFQD